MRCKYLKLLSRYADNEIPLDDKPIFEKHLLDCPVCSSELKLVRSLKEGISENKIETDPEFFWQQLKGRLGQIEKYPQGQEEIHDFGNWVKCLIPVPVLIGIAAIILFNAMPNNLNPVDEYIFGNGNGLLIDLIEEPGDQSVIGG